MAVVNPGATVWTVATRISQLDANGFIDAGAPTFTTNTLMKATLTPVYEAGDAIAVKTAAGELGVYAKHGDILKWGTFAIDFATPDPQLEQILCNGVVFSTSSAALGAPTGLAATGQTTLGVLAAGTYGYVATQYNSYGETVASTPANATTTGSTGAVVLGAVTTAAGALGVRYYGRVPGGWQLLGQQPVIGSQATSAASGTGTVTALALTALTSPIPQGFQFTIAGDTNTTEIVFTTTGPAGVGATTVGVTASQSVTTTIAAGAIQPVFFDTGAIVGNGSPPTTDYSAGPGTGTGYQIPAPGTTAAPNGCAIEMWSKRIINGFQASDYPYIRTVLPRVANMHIMARDYTNANLQTLIEGDAFRNPSFGTGPVGDWPFDSTQMSQRKLEGAATLPVAGFASIPATV